MKADTSFSVLSLLALAAARPIALPSQIVRREVPQEQSHNQFLATVRVSLALDNPAGIVDPVFGLLGDGVRSLALSLSLRAP